MFAGHLPKCTRACGRYLFVPILEQSITPSGRQKMHGRASRNAAPAGSGSTCPRQKAKRHGDLRNSTRAASLRRGAASRYPGLQRLLKKAFGRDADGTCRHAVPKMECGMLGAAPAARRRTRTRAQSPPKASGTRERAPNAGADRLPALPPPSPALRPPCLRRLPPACPCAEAKPGSHRTATGQDVISSLPASSTIARGGFRSERRAK
jgi:hypothetical protein